MCPPDHYRIASIDNPHMVGQTVDSERARRQWNELVDAYQRIGIDVILATPAPNLPDMVFTANPILAGPSGSNVVVPANMRHPGRRAETQHLLDALPEHKVMHATDDTFEGGGDFLWTPSGDLVAASGPRTDVQAIASVANIFDVVPLQVNLVNPQYYHLDTCLCILDDDTALWVPEAFDDAGRKALQDRFQLIDVSDEALLFAANAHCPDSQHVIIDAACQATMDKLRQHGFVPVPVDTSEFRKSGGSVYCMKHVVRH